MTLITQEFNQAKRAYKTKLSPQNYKRYSQEFKRFLMRKGVSSPDAEDIIQESIVKLLSTSRVLDEEQIKPYLARIVMNTMHDHKRLSAKRSWADLDVEVFSNTAYHAEDVYGRLKTEYVIDGMQNLASAKEHGAFREYYMAGKKVREISVSQQAPMGTISSQIKRSRDQIVGHLKASVASQTIDFVGSQPIYY